MPNVTVLAPQGEDKENVTAATIADKRWGQNGADWGTAQPVAAGNRTLTIYTTTDDPRNEQIDVSNDVTVTITVNDDVIQIQLS